MKWVVYILETQDGRLYTGITNNLNRRILMHRKGKGGAFTRSFKFKALLYSENQPDKSRALKREREIQSWPRHKKLSLISESQQST